MILLTLGPKEDGYIWNSGVEAFSAGTQEGPLTSVLYIGAPRLVVCWYITGGEIRCNEPSAFLHLWGTGWRVWGKLMGRRALQQTCLKRIWRRKRKTQASSWERAKSLVLDKTQKVSGKEFCIRLISRNTRQLT